MGAEEQVHSGWSCAVRGGSFLWEASVCVMCLPLGRAIGKVHVQDDCQLGCVSAGGGVASRVVLTSSYFLVLFETK